MRFSVAAKAGGGVVHLPTGVYKLALTTNPVGITMAPRVVLEGEGQNNTIINYGYGTYPSSGGYVLEWPNGISVAGIADLTLHNVNEQGHWYNTMDNYGKVSELFIQRIKLDMSSADAIYMQGMEKLLIENSVFTQTFNAQHRGPWELNGNVHFVIRGNSVTHATGWYGINNASDGVIENNHFTRNGGYTAVPNTRNLNLNFSINIELLNNTFDVVNGPVASMNDGETILSEGGGAMRLDESLGVVSSAGGQALQNASKNWNSATFSGKAIVAIVSGNGTGQWRQIQELLITIHCS